MREVHSLHASMSGMNCDAFDLRRLVSRSFGEPLAGAMGRASEAQQGWAVTA
jgi:hypothetical protein